MIASQLERNKFCLWTKKLKHAFTLKPFKLIVKIQFYYYIFLSC